MLGGGVQRGGMRDGVPCWEETVCEGRCTEFRTLRCLHCGRKISLS